MVGNHVRLPEFSRISLSTMISMLVYLSFLISSVYLIVRFCLYRKRIFLALFVHFLFNGCFFLIYGNEPHLYTSHYTFALIAMLAFPFTPTDRIPRTFLRFLAYWASLWSDWTSSIVFYLSTICFSRFRNERQSWNRVYAGPTPQFFLATSSFFLWM